LRRVVVQKAELTSAGTDRAVADISLAVIEGCDFRTAGAISEEPPPTRVGTDCAIAAEAAITKNATATA